MRFYHYLILLILFSCLWFFRLKSVLRTVSAIPNGAMVHVRGMVTSQPNQSISNQVFEIGGIFVYTAALPRFSYGDVLDVVGTASKRVTDFGIPQISLMYPNIRFIDEEQNTRDVGLLWIPFILSRFRQHISDHFETLLPEPQASLLSGVLLGAKERLPDEFARALRRTGTMHVVVASGYNVTVVAGVLALLLLRFLSRRKAIPLILAGVFAYAMMAGGDPPIVRASLMASLAYVAQILGRQYHGLWGLTFVSVLMLIISPLTLFDVGFQLSVAATAGILVLTPVLLAGVRKVKIVGWEVAEDLAVTLGAQLAVAPILLINFHQVSWLSPVINLLVVTVIPLIMGMGFLVAAAGFVWRELAQALAFLTWVPLTFFISVVSWFDRLPWGTFSVSSLSWLWALGYYLVLGWLVWWFWRVRGAQDYSNRQK